MSRDILKFKSKIIEIVKEERVAGTLEASFAHCVAQRHDLAKSNAIVGIMARFYPVDETHIELLFTDIFYENGDTLMYEPSDYQIFDMNASKEELKKILEESYDNYYELEEKISDLPGTYEYYPDMQEYMEDMSEDEISEGYLTLDMYSYDKFFDWIYEEMENAVWYINSLEKYIK